MRFEGDFGKPPPQNQNPSIITGLFHSTFAQGCLPKKFLDIFVILYSYKKFVNLILNITITSIYQYRSDIVEGEPHNCINSSSRLVTVLDYLLFAKIESSYPVTTTI